MAPDQTTLDDVIANAELIAQNGTPGELDAYFTKLVTEQPALFAALFAATVTADMLEPEELEKLQQLAAGIGKLH